MVEIIAHSDAKGVSIPTVEASEPVVTQWLRSGEYLPDFMRDFHDQKDLFKAMDEVRQRSIEKNGGLYMRDLSWTGAHVYTVDIFLWMMARHGYTLQRSRKRGVSYPDIRDFAAAAVRRWRDACASVLFSKATTARDDVRGGDEAALAAECTHQSKTRSPYNG